MGGFYTRVLSAQSALLGEERPEVLDRLAQPLLERDPGLPAELPLSPADVRPPPVWVALGQRLEGDRAGAAHDRLDRLGELHDGHLMRVADVARLAQVAHQQPPDPLDQ